MHLKCNICVIDWDIQLFMGSMGNFFPEMRLKNFPLTRDTENSRILQVHINN